MANIAKPPGFYYTCQICGSPMHFIGTWHCYTCGTDWTLEDIWDELDWYEGDDGQE